VLAGWELFKTQLHIHHTAEDADLWPRMRTHLADHPDELALLAAMEDEHAHIDPLLAAVDGALAAVDGGQQRLGTPWMPWPARCTATLATRSATCCR
jgi:hypothetical protein